MCGRRVDDAAAACVWAYAFELPFRNDPGARNALAYVLNNWRKHVSAAEGLDPCCRLAGSGDGAA